MKLFLSLSIKCCHLFKFSIAYVIESLLPKANMSQPIKRWIRFDYKSICIQFATTHYVIAYKTIHMYDLKKLHGSLNKLCMCLKYRWMILLIAT